MLKQLNKTRNIKRKLLKSLLPQQVKQTTNTAVVFCSLAFHMSVTLIQILQNKTKQINFIQKGKKIFKYKIAVRMCQQGNKTQIKRKWLKSFNTSIIEANDKDWKTALVFCSLACTCLLLWWKMQKVTFSIPEALCGCLQTLKFQISSC